MKHKQNKRESPDKLQLVKKQSIVRARMVKADNILNKTKKFPLNVARLPPVKS